MCLSFQRLKKNILMSLNISECNHYLGQSSAYLVTFYATIIIENSCSKMQVVIIWANGRLLMFHLYPLDYTQARRTFFCFFLFLLLLLSLGATATYHFFCENTFRSYHERKDGAISFEIVENFVQVLLSSSIRWQLF